MTRYQSYVICTSPRSGSTLLCRMLRAVGNAGCPESHFHVPELDSWLAQYALDAAVFDTHSDRLAAVFNAARTCGSGGGPLFGLRLQGHSFALFMSQLRVLHPLAGNDKQRIKEAFGRTLFIHLTRESKLDQAISLIKADQSGLWHKAPDGTEIERSAPAQKLPYTAPTNGTPPVAKLADATNLEWARRFQSQAPTPQPLPDDREP